ncbi:MAG: 1,4-alpha-glucan branching protein GlgB, partial [Clostridia bacterium]|nr:1,4-alpha-glucan branching protein GlgB [Clostridia bacterium]
MDFYSFYTGGEFHAHEFLGAHYHSGKTFFRVFAPAAQSIDVIGDFNSWTPTPMHRIHDGNFWEAEINNARPGMMYKYRITSSSGTVEHTDPFARAMELRPASASVICDFDYSFSDAAWMKKRSDMRQKPLNIYEMHFGSWKKPGEESDKWYTYSELAPMIIPYLKEHGYNYLELMPLAEHPCDESWGYQQTGFFAPTSRYGKPEELMYFVDECHKNNIGVILDFVSVHFASDYYALARFDGTPLYEYPNSAVGVSEWGSCNFMHSRGEVRSFLQSAANFWLSEYHFDGLRFDAISNLIYWQGDKKRGVNGATVDFLRKMTSTLHTKHPGVMLSAEDSTDFDGVTRPVSEGGLGFDYKWDMGWMNDTLSYFQSPEPEKCDKYHSLAFSMMYYYNERYLLPLSHDEVVHGKATIVQKMNGEYEKKFPAARAFYIYMYAHPGKKLNFMGSELAHLREWDEKRELDWSILRYPLHDSFNKFIKDLNRIYLSHPALSERDYDPSGFSWLLCNTERPACYAFERVSASERITAVFNFSDSPQALEFYSPSPLTLLLASDSDVYSGTTHS